MGSKASGPARWPVLLTAAAAVPALRVCCVLCAPPGHVLTRRAVSCHGTHLDLLGGRGSACCFLKKKNTSDYYVHQHLSYDRRGMPGRRCIGVVGRGRNNANCISSPISAVEAVPLLGAARGRAGLRGATRGYAEGYARLRFPGIAPSRGVKVR